ncbi:MAG: GreA/GreB family elongation factor [Methylophilaceae bacterium]
MSRGFVKEDDLELAGTDVAERPISPETNYVTPIGLAQLQSQANMLEKTHFALVPNKENPIIQQRLGSIERDLRYVQARLENALLIDPTSQSKATVLFGATVSIEDEHGDPHQYSIVGEDEADIALHKVSWLSPIAKALLGHKVGDSVVWKRPAGDLNLEILAIN